jgi:hypothetical protein
MDKNETLKTKSVRILSELCWWNLKTDWYIISETFHWNIQDLIARSELRH